MSMYIDFFNFKILTLCFIYLIEHHVLCKIGIGCLVSFRVHSLYDNITLSFMEDSSDF
jgi:hypothetical protein